MSAYSFKMERLMAAIACHEGWYPIGSAEYPDGSFSFKHHNPGNLRSSPFSIGIRNGYAVFKTDAAGWQALEYDITQKAKGNTVTKLTGASTLRDLIFVYAPPGDNNNSEKYLQDVVRMTGLPEGTTLKSLLY